jgi:class 3 adenylate cyclase
MTAAALDPGARPPITEAAERYLLLADISGYTRYLVSVEETHGVDFSAGVPAGYEIIAALLDAVVRGIEPELEVAKLEGDAVFAIAPALSLDGRGEGLLARLRATFDGFAAVQHEATKASDHICLACPMAGTLRLKMLLHRGFAVRVTGGSHEELHGPAVNIVHRLLKNSVEERVGARPYLFLTDQAAAGLHLGTVGIEHRESYPDVGTISGRIVDFTPEPVTGAEAREEARTRRP